MSPGEIRSLLRRTIGYVPQEGGLLPHWRVLRNVALVPWLRGEPDGEAKASAALRLVGLEPGRVRAPLAPRPVRRAAAAGRGGARAGASPRGGAAGRAVRGAGRDHPGRPPVHLPDGAARARLHRRAGHPRHRRGVPAGRPGGGAAARDGWSRSTAGAAPRRARHPLRGRAASAGAGAHEFPRCWRCCWRRRRSPRRSRRR